MKPTKRKRYLFNIHDIHTRSSCMAILIQPTLYGNMVEAYAISFTTGYFHPLAMADYNHADHKALHSRDIIS